MEKFDVIIIGGGAAGLSSAIYAARFNLKTLVIVKEKGGLLTLTHLVENWPGEVAISGMELMEKIEKHARSYELVNIKEEEVLDVAFLRKENLREKKAESLREKETKNGFVVKTAKNSYEGKTLIFATGTLRKKLNVKGEKEFTNRGISYCATCDAMLFRNKIVAVAGGGDSAAKEGLLLSEHCKKVYLIYRNELRAEPINMDRVKKKIKEGKIELVKGSVIEIKGERFVKSVLLDREFNGKKELNLEGVFVEIGGIPQTELAKKLNVKLNEKNEIIINENSETNVKGVFAAGDVGNKEFKQAITGASEGVIAAFSAYKYINRTFLSTERKFSSKERVE